MGLRTVPVVDLAAVEDDGKEVPDHFIRLARLDLATGARCPRRVGCHVDRGRKFDWRVDLDRLVARLVLEALRCREGWRQQGPSAERRSARAYLELEGEDRRNLLDAELLDRVLLA